MTKPQKNRSQKIIATLVVHGLPDLSKADRKYFLDWLKRTYEEMKNEDPKIFARRYRARLHNY